MFKIEGINMVKFKEILKKLDLDLDFDNLILELDLPVENIFDKYKYFPKFLNDPEIYYCTSSVDDTEVLKIYPNKTGSTSTLLELYSYNDFIGVGYTNSGEYYEFPLPTW